MTKLTISKFAGDYFFREGDCRPLLAVHHTKTNTLRIKVDRPEMGIYAPVDLPYFFCKDTLVIHRDHVEGFAEAVDANPCAACAWATGERLMPCAVNPYSFGTLCSDYKVK